MPRLSLAEFKALVREQYFMLLIDEDAAVAAIPALLAGQREERRKALAVSARGRQRAGEPTGEATERDSIRLPHSSKLASRRSRAKADVQL